MNAIPLPSIFRAVQEIFPDTTLRTGFSTQHKAAFVVAADLRDGLGSKSNTARFIQGIEAQQKGVHALNPLYVGDEMVITAGGPQRMRVVYKRGAFALLMRSDLP